ncbi:MULTISPECIES: BrnA antitoxin family protein [unclassified Bradyrhizobium]
MTKKLTRHPTRKEFAPGRGYTKADWDAVSDNPEWTREEIASARPFAEAHPELAASIKRRGPGKKARKEVVTLRLDPDVVAAYKDEGEGWQSRINADLRKAKKLRKAS